MNVKANRKPVYSLDAEPLGEGLSSPVERQFVMEFIREGGNIAAASRNVGIDRGFAYTLLARSDIQAAIQLEHEAALHRQRVSVDLVVREIAALAFSNPLDLYQLNDDGTITLDLATAPREAWASIKEITTINTPRGQQVTLKLHDKIKPLELLAKHTNALTPAKTLNKDPRDLTDDELRHALATKQS